DNRDSIHYSTFIDQRPVISKEEIMGLPNLCGYWKYESEVVSFRFPYHLSKQVTEGFKPREANRTKPTEMRQPNVQPVFTAKPKEPKKVRKLPVPEPQAIGDHRLGVEAHGKGVSNAITQGPDDWK